MHAIRNFIFLSGAVVLQLEENNQLKNELLRKTQELERDVGTLIHISFQVYHPKSLLVCVVY